MVIRFKRKKAIHLIIMCMLLSIVVIGCNQQETEGRDVIDGVDMDLSALNTLMAFAAIENITQAPEEHIGSTIRVTGSYFNFFSPDIEDYIHFILVADEGDCCVQGFEIRMMDGWTSPEEFPELETRIEVVGVYSFYGENERGFFYLAVYQDDLVVHN